MNCSPSDIARAGALLAAGELVAFPTETVYGLGANALSDTAVAAIYAAKERPQFNPLIVHVSSFEQAALYVRVTPLAQKLASIFWPGALTFVLDRTPDCPLSLLVSAGMDTVAVRSPAHPVAQRLLAAAGVPVAAPSANRSGRISPTEATHVREELDHKAITILDGGACQIGLESTVVDVRGEFPILLRTGSITLAQLQKAAGRAEMVNIETGYISPGMLASHYAPDHTLRLNATEVREGEALLAFGQPLPGAAITQNLSPKADLQEAAANLFRMLRLLDASGASAIAAMPIPDEGVGAAINDRLQRAAAPK